MDRVSYDSERSSRPTREARLKGVIEQSDLDLSKRVHTLSDSSYDSDDEENDSDPSRHPGTIMSFLKSDRRSTAMQPDETKLNTTSRPARTVHLLASVAVKGVLEQTQFELELEQTQLEQTSGLDTSDYAGRHLQSKSFNVLGDRECCRRVKHSSPLAARDPNAVSDRHSWTESVDRITYDSGGSSARPARPARPVRHRVFVFRVIVVG